MPILSAFVLPHPPLIFPEVGRGEETKIQKTIDAYRKVAKRIADLKPDTIVLATPHNVMYADYFHISPGPHAEGDLRRFGAAAPVIKVSYDEKFVAALSDNAGKVGLFAGTQGEKEPKLDHATLIPLRFINELYQNYRLVRLGVSGQPLVDHYRLGQCVAQTAAELKTKVVFIASADLSHRLADSGPYGFTSEGPAFDKQITGALAQGDFLPMMKFAPNFTEKAAECGLRPCVVMAGVLDKMNVKSELLSYEGPFGVGYAVAAFKPTKKNDGRAFLDQFLSEEQDRLKMIQESEDAYVRLARYALENYVSNRSRVDLPKGLPAEMINKQAGVFVSLKKHGELRGCIGTIGPVTKNIASEICRNAVGAAAEDPRFDPVRLDELDQLVYSVDVLDAPEAIDSPDKLDVSLYGVIVTKGRKRGLLLPNLEGVTTVEQQIDIACQKAGIKEDEEFTLERFKVVRHT